MIPINPWENQNAIKTLYAKCVGEICVKHDITRMELDILLFLANNPHFDTAKEIIEVRYLSKSQVSSSIKLLEERGLLKKEYTGGNRKTAHLVLCEEASAIIEDGRAAQEKFLAVILHGFTAEELECMKQHTDRMKKNIGNYLREETENV